MCKCIFAKDSGFSAGHYNTCNAVISKLHSMNLVIMASEGVTTNIKKKPKVRKKALYKKIANQVRNSFRCVHLRVCLQACLCI